jgi:hypothetical protein
MAHLTYRIVQHDGGWSYRADGVFSEPFVSHEAAIRAARKAAEEQRAPGETHEIQYQDREGAWHVEHSDGHDRPVTSVEP